jgi:glutathione peroxidase
MTRFDTYRYPGSLAGNTRFREIDCVIMTISDSPHETTPHETTPHETSPLETIPLTTIDGKSTSLADLGDKVFLIVNVASRCGLAPQYKKLEEMQKTYGDRGFSVLGFPSNQFLQELSTDDAIKEYCSTTWGITFPMFEKVKVNGKNAHPLYAELTKAPDSSGKAGKVKWNFEKFVITRDGAVHRFRPTMQPDSPEIVALIESSLPIG